MYEAVPLFAPDDSYLVKEYLSGATAKQVAVNNGVAYPAVLDILKRNGVAIRPGGQRAGQPSGRMWNGPSDPREHIRRYLNGESPHNLSVECGVARRTYTKWLIRQRVPIRGKAEQQARRMARTDLEGRRALTAAANVGRRKKPVTLSELHQRAAGRYRSQCHIGRGETEVADAIRLRGRRVEQQWPVGPYNIDVAVWPVAVEVYTGPYYTADAKRIPRDRFYYLADHGWATMFVFAPRAELIDTEAVTDYLIAWLDGADGPPPVSGEYRVIRGSGERRPSGRFYYDKIPRVVPAVAADDA